MAVDQDLRSALAEFKAAGILTSIDATISADFEAAAVLWALASSDTVVFNHVAGYSQPIVGNVLNDRSKLAVACGVPYGELQRYAMRAYQTPRPPVRVQDAPCQEVVISHDIDLGKLLPVPRISEFDSDRFITAGILIARDPVSGRTNLAISRLQLKGPTRLGCFLAQPDGDTARYLRAHREAGTRMDVAIAIGNHPVLLAASQMPQSGDELAFAGGLFGAGVQTASCLSVDIDVPAYAEVVIEGAIDPAVHEPEGPFGEFMGGYYGTSASPVIEVNMVTTRRDPMFQMIVGGTHPEHSVTGMVAREVSLLDTLSRAGVNATAVAFPVGGTGRFQAIVALRDASPDDAKTAMLTAFDFTKTLRQVVIVDDDIDVFDREKVDWALASRMDAASDIVVVDRCAAHAHDPVAVDGVVTKIGFDATERPGRERALERTMPAVPTDVMKEVLQRLSLPQRPVL